jgi:acyl-coenzyme A synthetase/AMP-(fatty) acid ligase
LLPFQAGTYAWFQLVLPSLCLEGQELVVPHAGADVAEILATALKCHADAISSTPTFWRVALMALSEDELKALSFRQISLGGEIVDQAILDQLRALYPDARITHIFAATEVGACIVVHDGLEGFPAAWLEDAGREVGLADREGILWVNSSKRGQNEGLAGLDGWICTGDLIERSGDRVRFKGRSGRQLINVGGQKAYPADVESVLLSHPEVRWCRVSARRAPLVGSLVSADVVLAPGLDGAVLEEELAVHCRSRLAEYAVPRFFRFLLEIPCSGNLKSSL